MVVTKADIRKWPVILTDVLFPSDFSGKKSPSNRKLLQKSSNIVSTMVDVTSIPSGKRLRNDGKSPCYLWVNHGKSTISTGPFSSSQTVNVYHAGYLWHGYRNPKFCQVSNPGRYRRRAPTCLAKGRSTHSTTVPQKQSQPQNLEKKTWVQRLSV